MSFIQKLRPARNRVSEALLDLSRRLASDDGWARLADREGAPNMLAGLLRLHDSGFRPRRAVDVGACQGDWTRLWHRAFPDCWVLMVEPQPRHYDTLARMLAQDGANVGLAPVLVGPPSMGHAEFHVLDDGAGGTGSSVLPELSGVPRKSLQLPVVTLDSVLDAHGGGTVDFLKLDVQGFELEVLKGATRTLASVPHVLLEVSLVNYNAGAPLLHEVVGWMVERQFHVREILDTSRARDGQLVQVDLLFSRV